MGNDLGAALYVKHRLATSPMRGLLSRARRQVGLLKLFKTPEMGLLTDEDRMMEAVLARIVKPGDHCVDIGGHIGSVSAQLRELASEDNLTIIEADPGKAEWLTRAFPKARIISSAVSDTAGEVEFFENARGSGFSSLQAPEQGGGRKQTLTCDTLDNLFADDARVDFIKIDIEGFEYPALKGGARVIGANRPVILFESGPHDDAAATPSTSENLFGLFADDLNYKVYSPFQIEHRRAPHDLASFIQCRRYPYLSFNFFAVPAEREAPWT